MARNPLKSVIKKDDRYGMAFKLASHKHDPIIKKLQATQQQAGLAIYHQIHKGMLAEMNALPEGWLQTTSSIQFRSLEKEGNATFNVPRSVFTADPNGSKVAVRTAYELLVELPKALPRLHNNQHYRISTSDPLVLAYTDALEAVLREAEARLECRERMEGMLESYRTYEKLYDAWPEVRELVKAWEPQPTKVTPAFPVALVDTKALNDEFGLPIKAA